MPETTLNCPDCELPGDAVMSNYDHDINEAQAARLKDTPHTFSRYAGWNFNARVWWTGTQWACEVWTYCVPQEIITADTLGGIMSAVCEKYGDE